MTTRSLVNGDFVRQALKKAFDWLASYELSCVLFLLLLLLTYLGTLYQVEHGLYQAQHVYFESLVLVQWVFGAIPIPLPGTYLLLIVLAVNLTLGGIIRVRMGWSKFGTLVTHAGILVLLVGAFVSYRYAVAGHLTLYEHESSNEFQSSNEWEIAVGEATGGPAREYLIPARAFTNLRGALSRSFRFPDLPFDVTLHGFSPNARPMPATAAGGDAVDGFVLAPREAEREQEANQAGVLATIRETQGGAEKKAILWAGAYEPWVVQAGGKTWSVDLRLRRWTLPFTVTLDKFTRELHPQTNMARKFTSDVTKTEEGVAQKARITMNEPLRNLGYTLYQSSWGPSNARPGDRLYSVFAVVRNPTERFAISALCVPHHHTGACNPFHAEVGGVPSIREQEIAVK
ncbi:MAG: cytochrome c biogenesis protein ResB [Candidatus Hydrogenedentes bacterium]|nr:cytochrome c biogenesis protein ResB [Candidatus Hydrogenedentota bacterium]